MRRIAATVRLLPLFALLPMTGCEKDPAELVKEINDARGECDEAKLRAGDEECVQMMERYAGMGVEAIQTYIGAVKAMNQALDRMPPPQFDTAGLGHPFDPSLVAARRMGDSAGALAPGAGPRFQHGRAPGWGAEAEEPWGAEYPDDGAPGSPPPYHDQRSGYASPGPYGAAPGGAYPYDPRYDSYDRAGGYPAPSGRFGGQGGRDGYPDPRGWDDEDALEEEDRERARIERGSGRGYDRRRGDWREPPARTYDPAERDPRTGEGYGAPPRAPERGRLLPPGERLGRPWLDDERARPRVPQRNAPREWQDSVSRWEPARTRPRSPGGAPR